MRLTVIIILVPLIALACSSCDKQMEFFPAPCQCDIEQLTLSEPSSVTYHVATDSDATVSSITYQLGEEQITIEDPKLPFSATVQLNKGETVSLAATGNPKNGNIILTYETQTPANATSELSSSVSRVWIRSDGECQ